MINDCISFNFYNLYTSGKIYSSRHFTFKGDKITISKPDYKD